MFIVNKTNLILATTIVDLETFVSQSHCNFAASKYAKEFAVIYNKQ